MKVWADLSGIVKLAAVCLTIGFLIGFFASGANSNPAEQPQRTPSTTSSAGLNPT